MNGCVCVGGGYFLVFGFEERESLLLYWERNNDDDCLPVVEVYPPMRQLWGRGKVACNPGHWHDH